MRYANRALGAIAVVVLVPLLYVLSLGPAVRLLNQEGVPPQVWNTYHGPAWLIASHSDAFDQAMQRYMGLRAGSGLLLTARFVSGPIGKPLD